MTDRFPPDELRRRSTRGATRPSATRPSVLRQHIETLRRLKYRPTGGFTFSWLADPAPMISARVLDHERRPKLAWAAVVEACRPVIVVADPLPSTARRRASELALDVHVVNDLRAAGDRRDGAVTASWRGGRRDWAFRGDVAADSVQRVGRLELAVPAEPGDLLLGLAFSGRDADGAHGDRHPPRRRPHRRPVNPGDQRTSRRSWRPVKAARRSASAMIAARWSPSSPRRERDRHGDAVTTLELLALPPAGVPAVAEHEPAAGLGEGVGRAIRGDGRRVAREVEPGVAEVDLVERREEEHAAGRSGSAPSRAGRTTASRPPPPSSPARRRARPAPVGCRPVSASSTGRDRRPRPARDHGRSAGRARGRRRPGRRAPVSAPRPRRRAHTCARRRGNGPEQTRPRSSASMTRWASWSPPCTRPASRNAGSRSARVRKRRPASTAASSRSARSTTGGVRPSWRCRAAIPDATLDDVSSRIQRRSSAATTCHVGRRMWVRTTAPSSTAARTAASSAPARIPIEKRARGASWACTHVRSRTASSGSASGADVSRWVASRWRRTRSIGGVRAQVRLSFLRFLNLAFR